MILQSYFFLTPFFINLRAFIFLNILFFTFKVNTLTPISNLATFAGEMISWIWFKSSVKGKEVSRNQAVPSEKFLRFCHEVLATSKYQPAQSKRKRKYSRRFVAH